MAAGQVVLIWDGLSAHWSTKMRAWLDSQHAWLTAERLPAYAGAEPGRVSVGCSYRRQVAWSASKSARMAW